jgi:dihydropyrimidinase
MIYLFSEGVIKRNLPVSEFVRMTSTNAALFYNLYPQKGVIRKGSDADLVIIDPAPEWTWNAQAIAGATDYSVLDGLKLTGRISHVIKGGKTVMRDGKVLAEKGSGRFVATAGR